MWLRLDGQSLSNREVQVKAGKAARFRAAKQARSSAPAKARTLSPLRPDGALGVGSFRSDIKPGTRGLTGSFPYPKISNRCEPNE